MQNYSQAITDLNKSIELGLNEGEVFYNRGKCYKKSGYNEQADEDFANAKELGCNG